MRLDSFNADVEQLGYLFRRPSLGDQLQHLTLPRAQRRQQVSLRNPLAILDQRLPRSLRRDINVALHHGVNRLLELSARRTLRQKPRCSLTQRAYRVFPGLMHRQDDDPNSWIRLRDMSEHVEPAPVRHRDVQQNQVRLMLRDKLYGLASFSSLANNRHAFEFLDQRANSRPH